MQNALIASILFLLLVASWFIFVRFYHQFRSRESTTRRRFDEVRKQLQGQNASIDLLVTLLNGIHESGAKNPGAGTKKSLAKMIVDASCQIMKCPGGSLMLVDREKGELEPVWSKGLPETSGSAVRLKLGEGIAGRIAESGKMIVVDDIQTDTRFMNSPKIEPHLRSLIALPMKVKDRVIGVLSVHADRYQLGFRESNVGLMTILVDESAMAIENVDLYSNLQNYYMEMIETLAKALDFKEFHLENRPAVHHDRDRGYARVVAQELDLPESIVRFIEIASLVHGVGKIGIEESILRKPGKLTPEEYEQVKRHPEIGQEIISKVKFLSPVVPMVLYHQERWDGKGYPAGLKGEEIPLGSRIVAVINAFSAMAADRPYRKALQGDEIVEELRKGAGTQFDSRVVDAFVRVLERDKGNQSDNKQGSSGSFSQQSESKDRVGQS